MDWLNDARRSGINVMIAPLGGRIAGCCMTYKGVKTLIIDEEKCIPCKDKAYEGDGYEYFAVRIQSNLTIIVRRSQGEGQSLCKVVKAIYDF